MTINHRNFLYQYIATVTACLSMMSTGLCYGWPSPSLPVLLSPDSPINVSNEQGSLIIAMQEYGNIVGALLAGYIVDVIGRKRTILVSCPCFFVGWILLASANSLYFIYCARFISGFTNGLVYTAVPTYLSEISHPDIRGFLGSAMQISCVFGMLTFNIAGSYLDPSLACYIAAGIPVIQLIAFFYMPESSYYLVMKQKHEEAHKSLQKFNSNVAVEKLLSAITESVTENQNKLEPKRFELLTDKANRKAVFITFILRLFQQGTGIIAINFYIQTIFSDLDVGISPSIISIIYFILQFLMCFVSSNFVDKTGRKPLLIYSFIGTGIANAALGAFFLTNSLNDLSLTIYKYIPVVSILVYVIVYNIGLASIPMILNSELFNTKVKAVALCAADIYYSLLIIVISMFFQYIKDNFGIFIPFFVFAVLSFIGFFFVRYFVPETKGLTLEEIQDNLNNRPHRNNKIEI